MESALLPPELISAQLYAGPGSGPLLTAATGWDGLAAQLRATATGCRAAIGQLTSQAWLGPSSAAMATAVAPYIAWLSTTAVLAEQSAAQARAAAGAFDVAFAATVPPAAIAANRSQLAALLATDALGLNTAAIAATEAQYDQMWAQDAAMMTGYAAATAAATRLTSFAPPPTASTAPPLGRDTASVAARGAVAIGRLSPAVTSGSATSLASVWQNLFTSATALSRGGVIANSSMGASNLGMVQFKASWRPPVGPAPGPKAGLGAGLGQPRTAPGGGLRAATAALGSAPAVGALSVPPSWASGTPAIRLVAATETGLAAAPAAEVPAGLVSPAALGSLTGGGVGGYAPRPAAAAGVRVRAGKDGNDPVNLDEVIAQLRQARDTVQHWRVDPDGLDDLLEKLATRPGLHAVHLAPGGTIAGKEKVL